MTAYTIIMIQQIAWGVGIFALGMLVGYALKLVLGKRVRSKGTTGKELVINGVFNLLKNCIGGQRYDDYIRFSV